MLSLIIILVVIVILAVIFRLFLKAQREYDGEMVVTSTIEGGKMFSLELYGDPNDLEFKKRVVFKVVNEESQNIQ